MANGDRSRPASGFAALRVIPGTDFAAVRLGDLKDVPVRYIPEAVASRKRLQPWDILIETAGGSKGRPTGRTMLVTPRLVELAQGDLTCASFVIVKRILRKHGYPPGKQEEATVTVLQQAELFSDVWLAS